jgi:thiaminase
MLLERKTISIYAYSFEPTVAITYNVNSEGVVENFQFWIREDYKYNYSILRRILDMLSQLENIEPFSEVIEKDIFRAYQKAFDIESLNANYTIKVDEFRTKKMSKTIKPYRNFIKSSKQSINIFIKNYIEKGE